MKVKIIKESGYEEALLGLSLSFKDREISLKDWWTTEKFEQMKKVSQGLAGKGKGHDKFLRQIQLWIEIEAPLEFWKQLDTYKVGTVAQSESTMHTLDKRRIKLSDLDLSKEDLDRYVVGVGYLEHDLYKYIHILNQLPSRLKSKLLPQCYLQRRLWTCNYQVLSTIISQRLGHKLPEWKLFIGSIYEQVEHPEYLMKRD